MPDTYTKEQIDTAKNIVLRAIRTERPRDLTVDACKILLSALSTAEWERDESKSKAEQYYNDWYVSKAEFGNITAKLRDRVRTAEARCAELEARLQGAGWISVDERLPEALTCVLIRFDSLYGKSNTGVAEYVPPKTVLAEDFLDENAEGCSEYDSKNDCYWVIEGWWENSWEAQLNYKISGNVTHWMPLPEPPAILGEKEEQEE